MVKRRGSLHRRMKSNFSVASWVAVPPIFAISCIFLEASVLLTSPILSVEAFSTMPAFGNALDVSRIPGSIILSPVAAAVSRKNAGDQGRESQWHLFASLSENNAASEDDSSGRKHPDQARLYVSMPASLGRRTTSASSPLPDRPNRRKGGNRVGGFDPSERIGEGINVGDPQIKVEKKDFSVTSILRELAAIQQKGPQKYCILGTRHCSYLHQQIIELLAYALVLSGNHVYTSGAGGTHAATIRGALRAERPDLLTVVLPQSLSKQTKESQKLLEEVEDVVEMPQNNDMSLDIASRICNSKLLSLTDQLISFAFHESTTVIEATKEAKKLDMLVTVLYLD